MGTRYDHLSREELIALLVKRDAERKLGLVWERNIPDGEPEEGLPVFEIDRDLSVGSPPYRNLLIEGDNLAALRILRAALRGKVRCIYIDPPYNRGNRDFIYQDRFVEKDDAYRHSKWLEFLYQRLTLARELLAPDGVLLASIDDDNHARLDLLLEQVFPGMRIGSLVWRKRRTSNAANIEHFFSCDHEYILAYGGPRFAFAGSEKRWSGYTNWDERHQDWWASDNLTLGFTREQRPNLYYPLYNPETDIWYPCDPNNVWRFASRERLNGREVRTAPMEDLIAEGRVYFPPEDNPAFYHSVEEIKAAIAEGTAPPFLEADPNLEFWVGKKIGRNKPRLKRFKKELRNEVQPLSSWIAEIERGADETGFEEEGAWHIRSGMTAEGTRALRAIGLSFPYPKPPSLLRNLVRQATGPDDLVLDFFAGSGTTGQAVLEVNAEDGGNRRFILVSSTEATADNPDRNVCRDVAQPRLKAVLERLERETGKPQPGFAYLRVRYLPRMAPMEDEHAWLLIQQLHLQTVAPLDPEDPVAVAEGEDVRVAFIRSVSEKTVQTLQTWVEAKPKPTVVYSWQPGLIRPRLPYEHVAVEGLPWSILQRLEASVR